MTTTHSLRRWTAATIACGVLGTALLSAPVIATAAPAGSGVASPAASGVGVFTGTPSPQHQAYVAGLRATSSIVSGVASSGSLTSKNPPSFTTFGVTVQRSIFQGFPVYTMRRTGGSTARAVVYVHGGAYVMQPASFQWYTAADYVRETGAEMIIPIYPVAGDGGRAATVVPAIADLISQEIARRGAQNLSVLGDSAGGGLALAATQEQVRRGTTTARSLVLIAPWLDVTVSDPRSRRIDDPILNVNDLLKDGKAWAGGLATTDPRVSPLFGSLRGLPPTTVYSGSLDLLSPDSVRLQQRAVSEGVPMTFVLRRGLIHAWTVFPYLPEAYEARPGIYRALGLR